MKKEYAIEASLKDNFEIESNIRGHLIYADQQKKDSTEKGPSPVEYLLFSLASCYGTIIRIVAKQKNIPINNVEIKVSGILDSDKLLGKETNNRAGFEAIKLKIIFEDNISKDQKNEIINAIKLRCPVSENLINNTPIYFE